MRVIILICGLLIFTMACSSEVPTEESEELEEIEEEEFEEEEKEEEPDGKLELTGTWYYQLYDGQIILEGEKIENNHRDWKSGTLRLEFHISNSPYSEGDNSHGYFLASSTLDGLPSGDYYYDVVEYMDVDMMYYQNIISGHYHAYMLLSEYDDGGYYIRDYINFDGYYVVDNNSYESY